ncbi:hypothetical protein M9M90_03115 [Phenylobacterium sp. LH3H17]|uniref:hypothetical protein n=1 Tax=Phenylobacterium sp. LH3H17 TaxID=2903901 RepID=UPI0020C98A4E|nr:hypothetical protein [Phenylobacterium sp. LH3H17]UTP40180.1 hypothetical protein M9M90_03115 [Phenylobacterium sp. LH3H17]
MSGRRWGYVITAGGLAALFGVWLTWWYSLPQQPRIARYEASQGPERGYKLGGAACDPKRLNALPPEKAPSERDRCAQIREDHRVQQAVLFQAVRANDLSEGNLRVAHQQARIAFAQTIATVLAFIAASVAAVFAGLAVYHSKRSADADNEALAETREAAGEARAEAARQAKRYTDQLGLMDQTMHYTADNAAAMGRVADAMATNIEKINETVDINRSIAARQKILGEGQLRAYVSVQIGGALYQDDNYVFEANPVLYNSGGTPAHKVTWRVAAAVLPVPLPDDFRFPLPERPRRTARSLLLPPQQTFEMRGIVDGRIEPGEVLRTKLGFGQALYVWGVVSYRDIFRRSHRTTFAQQVFWRPSGPTGPDGTTPEIIRGSYLPHHNKSN